MRQVLYIILLSSRDLLKTKIFPREITARRLRLRLRREEVVEITEVAELTLASRRRRRQAELHRFERRLVLKPPHPRHVLVRIDHRRRLGGRRRGRGALRLGGTHRRSRSRGDCRRAHRRRHGRERRRGRRREGEVGDCPAAAEADRGGVVDGGGLLGGVEGAEPDALPEVGVADLRRELPPRPVAEVGMNCRVAILPKYKCSTCTQIRGA